MTIKTYFNSKFESDLRKLQFSRANPVEQAHVFNNVPTLFFGGQDWRNARDDFSGIPEMNRIHFMLCLFLITVADQCIHAHFNAQYETWRSKTNYPKFGWTGFGNHFENPLKILGIPEAAGIVDADRVIPELAAFLEFVREEATHFFAEDVPGIEPLDFIDKIRRDDAFIHYNEGRIVKSLKDALDELSLHYS